MNSIGTETAFTAAHHNTQPHQAYSSTSTPQSYARDRTSTISGRSGQSGSSNERLDTLPDLGGNEAARLASNSLLQQGQLRREKSARTPEELRRRGSVDERTATMTLSAGMGRLYVANPDEDSD
jgi:hypothetical protein